MANRSRFMRVARGFFFILDPRSRIKASRVAPAHRGRVRDDARGASVERRDATRRATRDARGTTPTRRGRARRRDDARGPAEAREVRRDRAERGLTTTTTTTGFERRMSAAMSAKARTVVKLSATTRKSRGGTGRRGATTRAANGEKPWGDSTQCVQNGASNDEERRAMDARWCIKM